MAKTKPPEMARETFFGIPMQRMLPIFEYGAVASFTVYVLFRIAAIVQHDPVKPGIGFLQHLADVCLGLMALTVVALRILVRVQRRRNAKHIESAP